MKNNHHKDQKHFHPTLTLFGVVLSLAIVGVLVTSVKGAESGLLISEQGAGSAIGADLITTLRELNSIHLNKDLFESPVFKSLQDFGLEVVSEPYQRKNPFAPIGTE